MQINGLSKVPYQGKNQDTLEEVKMVKHYGSDEWVTFIQARQVGKKVKEGQHGVRLVKVTEREDEKGKKWRGARRFTVFNFDQLSE